ncbi:hypothetical protein MIND_00615800 [Mycena indigotica]|uniref:Uncharacterized protein n=1 Tax=Mycena indigotica TaxID=2126181 RepID=A0A8H6SR37_9AGAR|nr:uncharacterized protein MIND_00615800 [Mycena indigotica]KAF7303859.1 hypothetical protein MIND_00615800 [Mycena indigotica]
MAYTSHISCPPTTNALSNQQRSQLLRTTQKLGRILGTTPALLEEKEEMPLQLPLNLQRLAVPLHVQLSSMYSDDDALVRYPSSDTLFSSDYDTPSYIKRPPSSASDRSRRSVDSGKSVQINESWPRPQTERPFLRIKVDNSSKLESIPQSPPAESYSPPPAYSLQSPHTSYTIPASRIPVTSQHTSPFAVLPSANSMRRQKMDKLRRTLGDGVPLHMVFPDDTSPDDSPLSSSSEEDLPILIPQRRIRHARDSLLLPSRIPTEKKLSIIAEREEAYLFHPPSPSERGSVDSDRYEGDTEGDATSTIAINRRSSQGYPHKIKRVPVPVA